MTNEKFDRLLSTIRNEHVDDKIVDQASDRVWTAITGDSPSAGDGSPHASKLRRLSVFDPCLPRKPNGCASSAALRRSRTRLRGLPSRR